MNDEQEIQALVERWAAAVHAGDLEMVLDRHTDDSLARQIQAATRLALASLQRAERDHLDETIAAQRHEPSPGQW